MFYLFQLDMYICLLCFEPSVLKFELDTADAELEGHLYFPEIGGPGLFYALSSAHCYVIHGTTN